jgi:hypothetical protein
MLQLFQSIFGSERDKASAHSPDLIARAIERAVDATDPRLRTLPGYQKKLRSAVIHAIDHVVGLVDSLPPALELSAAAFGTNPEVTTFFASIAHLHEVLERDSTLNQWLRSADGGAAERIVMLLLMTLDERQVLGVALEGDTVRQGVAQTTVSFSKHQLLDPSRAEDDIRPLLKRRAFDHLLELALSGLATALSERGELERERAVLKRKRAALAAGRWGFDDANAGPPADPGLLQQQLQDIESQLSALGAGAGLLTAHLGIVVDVLTGAERNFWHTRRPLIVDRMGVKQTQASALAPEIGLTVLHNAAGQSLVARVVSIRREALPPQRDLLREAERYLG